MERDFLLKDTEINRMLMKEINNGAEKKKRVKKKDKKEKTEKVGMLSRNEEVLEAEKVTSSYGETDLGEGDKEDEEAVIQNLLKLREMKVTEIMTPRVVMTSVKSTETVKEVMDRIPIMIHGRMPVYVDSVDEMSGLVLRSEILRKAADDDFDTTMGDLCRELVSCDVDTSVDKALDILLENKEQLLIAKDQFGGTAGLVTMEDIIETLLGVEIVDESDQDAIDDGVLHEDMRELARSRYDSEPEQ